LEELQDLVEAGPDWHSIEKIEITLARRDGVLVMTMEATAAKAKLPFSFATKLSEKAEWTRHPSGDGFIVARPEHPTYWVKNTARPLRGAAQGCVGGKILPSILSPAQAPYQLRAAVCVAEFRGEFWRQNYPSGSFPSGSYP
jgi:hypothetical protein